MGPKQLRERKTNVGLNHDCTQSNEHAVYTVHRPVCVYLNKLNFNQLAKLFASYKKRIHVKLVKCRININKYNYVFGLRGLD